MADHTVEGRLGRMRVRLRRLKTLLHRIPFIPEAIMAAIDDELDELNTMAQGFPALIQAQEATAVAAGTAAAVATAQAVTQTKVDTLKTTLTGIQTSLTPVPVVDPAPPAAD